MWKQSRKQPVASFDSRRTRGADSPNFRQDLLKFMHMKMLLIVRMMLVMVFWMMLMMMFKKICLGLFSTETVDGETTRKQA